VARWVGRRRPGWAYTIREEFTDGSHVQDLQIFAFKRRCSDNFAQMCDTYKKEGDQDNDTHRRLPVHSVALSSHAIAHFHHVLGFFRARKIHMNLEQYSRGQKHAFATLILPVEVPRYVTQREQPHILPGTTLIAACFPYAVFCSKIQHFN